MPRGTKLRNVRVADDLWLAAKTRAAAEGTTVTAVIVAALRAYTTKTAPPLDPAR